MRFEKINGIQHIIIEENDAICLTTSEELHKKKITIKNINGGLDISGDASIVSSIRGDGMLDKIYIPPVLSSEEMIEKCDRWLDMFKQVHDTFKELVLTKEYNQDHVSMHLSFPVAFSFNGVKKRKIDLNLVQYGTTIREGVSIYVDEENEDVYAYLIANVLEYYVQNNYEEFKIDRFDPSFNSTLYSDFSTEMYTVAPMVAPISNLTDDSYYSKIVGAILANHGLGVSSERYISNLRSRITCHQFDEIFEEYLEYSASQYEDIVSNLVLDKGPVLKKTND